MWRGCGKGERRVGEVLARVRCVVKGAVILLVGLGRVCKGVKGMWKGVKG